MRDSGDALMLKKVYRTINKLGPESTLKQIDGVISDLRNLITPKKASEAKLKATIADRIALQLRDRLMRMRDDYIRNSVDWGGAESFIGEASANRLQTAIRNYDTLS